MRDKVMYNTAEHVWYASRGSINGRHQMVTETCNWMDRMAEAKMAY